MKKQWKRFMAITLASAMLTSSAYMPVFAEESIEDSANSAEMMESVAEEAIVETEGINTNDYMVSEDEVAAKLDTLIAEHNDTYWTTDGQPSDSEGTTSKKHGDIQSKGFANFVFNELFGVWNIGEVSLDGDSILNPDGAEELGHLSSIELKDVEALKNLFGQGKSGDYIQAKYRDKEKNHSAILIKVLDDGVELLECDVNEQCDVQCHIISWSKFAEENLGVSLYRASNYEIVEQESEEIVEEVEETEVLNEAASGNIVASGACGENLTWTLDDQGTLTISGQGEMENYDSELSVPWYDRHEEIITLKIVDGVTTIGNHAFSDCSGITGDLVLPSSLVDIGESAFEWCIGFNSELIIPDGVKNIGDKAFYCCKNLSGELEIPSSVTTIGNYAFAECESLTGGLWIPDSVVFIGAAAFRNCKSLTGELRISNSITSVESEVFRGCEGFTGELHIPDSVMSIGTYAFSFCSGFSGNLVLSGSLVDIGECAFERCTGFDGNLIIPDGVKSIGESAFYACSHLKGELRIPNSVVNIEPYAFDCCEGFTGNLRIPDSITTISNGVFYGCSGFTGLTIPDSVTTIGDGTFCGCSGFTGNLTIPDSVVTIDENAFCGCSGFTGDLVIPDSVSSIRRCVFRDCSGFTGLVIPDNSITSIQAGAFRDCSGFVGKLIIPDNITSIGMNAFEGCSGFTGVTIPDSVTTIGEYAFYECSGFTGNLTIPNNVTTIGKYAFGYCSGFTGSLTISDGVTTIGEYAFYECSGFTGDLTIPDSVTTVGVEAFWGCSGFTGNLTISAADIHGSAFFGCSGFTSLTILDGVKSIAVNAFRNCSGFTGNLTIPGSVGAIGEGAFRNCNGFTNITISESEDRIVIDNFVFVDMQVKQVYFLGDAPWIFDKAFQNVEATAYYPSGNSTWTPDVMQNYGGKLTWKEWNPDGGENSPGISDVDNYIIEEVRKYTSDQEYAQLMAIMNANTTDEEKFRRLNELFGGNNGITDIQEGIKYLSETTPYRSDYLYMTTNDIYCAHNFWNWLYTPPWGTLARGLLYADGLIFNLEVFDYVDFKTIVEADFPGVKKNKQMLKNFMGVSEDGFSKDVCDYSKKSAEYLENIIKLNEIKVKDEAYAVMRQIGESTSETERDRLVKSMVNDYIMPAIEASGTDKVYLDGEYFGKALGYATSVLEFGGAAAEDIIDMLDLNNEIAMYQKYSRFLTTIYENTDVSFEMRLAAFLLLDDISNGWWDEIVSLLGDVLKLEKDLIYTDKTILNTFLEEHGITGGGVFSNALSTLKLGVFISNIVVDMEDFVNQAAYTQGYAELSALYSMKLEEDKRAFQAEESAENAWRFFEDYTLLWNLRYEGEKQYLRMNEIKMYLFAAVKGFNYDIKKEIVEDNLARLEECKFDIPPEYTIPSSVQYVQKSVVHCPVDVEVYTQDGTLIVTLKDGEESDLTNEYGRFTVVRQSYDGEYAKVVCQNTDEELVIKLKAVENGLVDFESSDAVSIHTFDNLQVEAGDSVEIIGDSYTFDAKDDGEEDASGTLVEKDYDTYVRVENVSIQPAEVQLGCGEESVLDITITPENATNTTINWVSMDEDIAVVKNGVITGVSEGSTVVFAKMIDTEIEEIQIPVTVVGEEKIKYPITYDANGGQSAPKSQEKIQGQALKLTEDKPEKSYVITYDANGGSIGSGSKNIGCTFKNWNTKADGSGTEYNSGDEYTLDESVTLYAQWTEPAAGIMETPTRSGYTFDGWYTAVDGGSKVETSTVINGNMTLYAHWTAATYSVRYDANGGSGAPDAQEKIQDETQVLSSTRPTKTYKVTYNANVTNIESVSKDISCIFKNWNTQANGSGASYNSGEHYTENQDVTLYAQWENPKIGILTSPSRPGYIFDGWYTQLNGGTKVASSATVTGDMMLYAHWTKEVSKDPVEAFVSRLYKEILGRDADPSGLKAWADVLKSGKEQGAKVAQGFIDSEELKKRNLSDDAYIRALYRTFFDREADDGGLAAWQKVMDSGLSRMHVFRGFAESDEFTKICDSYGIIRGYADLTAPMDQNEGVTKFIVRSYRLCLNREADADGLNGWCDAILSGKNTAKEAAYGFVFSNEFLKKNLSDREYVKVLYRVFMDREADGGGLSSWEKVLKEGKSREHVFNGFADSAEFRKICQSYGIR